MRPPRLNYFGGEGERDPAVVFTGVDPPGTAPGDGGELGTTAAIGGEVTELELVTEGVPARFAH